MVNSPHFVSAGTNITEHSGFVEVPEMPFAATAVNWFDFTDITTLFQTEDTSTPVTTNGQDIGRVENKGSESVAMTQAGVNRPTYKADALNGFSGGNGDGSTNVLFGTVVDGAVAGDLACFWVARLRATGDFSTIFGWDAMAGATQARVNDDVHTARVEGAVFQGTDVIAVDEAIAGWCADDGAAAQSYRFHGEAEINTAIASGGPADSRILAIFATDNTASAGFTFNGDILEVVTTEGDYANRALWEAYVTAKYGITWV